MSLTPRQRQRVKEEFTGLVGKAFDSLRGLSLKARPVNPFFAALVARTPDDLARFIVGQRVERGVVTSLGIRIQKVALAVGTAMHPSGVPEADLEGRDEDLKRHRLMQVKIGPDTINKTMASGIERNLKEAENRIKLGGQAKGWVVEKMLGMCYGRPEHRSAWVIGLGKSGFDVDRIGREFWAFITGEQDAYKEVFDIALTVAATYQNSSGKTLPQLIEDTIQSLTLEIETKYGDGQGGIHWGKLLEDNM